MAQVEVILKSGKTIKVRRDEVQGLRDEKLIDESKLSAELKKPLEKKEGTKVIGKASVGNIPKKPKEPVYPIGYVEVELKSGKTIPVKKYEVDGLREAGLLKDGKSKAEKEAEAKADREAKELAEKEAKEKEMRAKQILWERKLAKAEADKKAKEKEEKEKAKTKEEKATGTITKVKELFKGKSKS